MTDNELCDKFILFLCKDNYKPNAMEQGSLEKFFAPIMTDSNTINRIIHILLSDNILERHSRYEITSKGKKIANNINEFGYVAEANKKAVKEDREINTFKIAENSFTLARWALIIAAGSLIVSLIAIFYHK
jgi:hypothetical protein